MGAMTSFLENKSWIIRITVTCIILFISWFAQWGFTSTKATTPNHGRVTSLAFLDSTHGWLLTSYGVAMGSESIEVFQTNDGGTSWKSTASTNSRQAISNGLPITGDKNGLIFVNQKNGWLTGFSHGDGIWLYSSWD